MPDDELTLGEVVGDVKIGVATGGIGVEGYVGMGVELIGSPMVIVWVLLQSLNIPVNCEVPIGTGRGSHDV